MTATWRAIPTPSISDWLGLYGLGAGDTSFLAWRYTTAENSGSVSFELPRTLPPGNYEVRLFANNGFTRLAATLRFMVATTVRVGVSPTTVAPGGTVTATWSAIPTPSISDWLGLYALGAADTSFLAWRYTTAENSGSVSFEIPRTLPPGNYELRLFANNGFTRLAATVVFTVASTVRVNVSRPIIAPGGTVTASWSGILTPTTKDWLGLYALGASDTSFLAWRYTTGRVSGGVPFMIPPTLPPGNYELRLLANNGFTRLAATIPFRIQ